MSAPWACPARRCRWYVRSVRVGGSDTHCRGAKVDRVPFVFRDLRESEDEVDVGGDHEDQCWGIRSIVLSNWSLSTRLAEHISSPTIFARPGLSVTGGLESHPALAADQVLSKPVTFP